MAARQALRFTKELAASPGTFDASAVAASITHLRMTTPVTDQPKPIAWVIRAADSTGRRSQTGSAQNDIRLSITTPLYISQATLLLGAFFNTAVGTGAGLATFTIDRFLTLEDASATKSFLRMVGMTPESLTITANNNGQGVLAMLNMSFVGRGFDRAITVTDYPIPADTVYPTDTPYYFENLAGGVTLATSRTNFKDFNLSLKNSLSLNYDENANPSPKFYGNRDVDWTMTFLMKLATDRTKFDAMTPSTASFVFARGTTSITINCHDNNYFANVEDELPFDGSYYQKISGQAYFDPAAGSDCSLTVDAT